MPVRPLLAAALALLPTGLWASEDLPAEVLAVRAAATPYQDIEIARLNGWIRFGAPAALLGQHYAHRDRPDYAADAPLNPNRASNLLYAEIGGQDVLVALAFNYRLSDRDVVPDGFQGEDDIWHVHGLEPPQTDPRDRSLWQRLTSLIWAPDPLADPDVTPERQVMVHVWTIPNPDGPFASHNRALAYLQHGLPAAWADGASVEAALGLALAAPNGCAIEIDEDAGIAGLPRAATQALHAACRDITDRVRASLGSPASANAAGEAAWRAYAAFRDQTLTPIERLRIASLGGGALGALCR
ncbi:MAG: hypothetical protein AAF366_00800 [Pseudomonadota bacterium]